MSKVEKLDLMGVVSLGAVTAALLVGWMVTTAKLAPVSAPQASPDKALTLTQSGSMKLTVTAPREQAVAATTGRSRVASRSATAPALSVSAPFVFRP